MRKSIDEIEANEAFADVLREDQKLIAEAKILIKEP
jgi:hypothetical protein